VNSPLPVPLGAITATLRANEAVGWCAGTSLAHGLSSPHHDEYDVVNEQQSGLCQATLFIGL
jgi:hypothetical protein